MAVVAAAALATSAAEMGTLRAMERRRKGARPRPPASVMLPRIILLEENIFNVDIKRNKRGRKYVGKK